MQVTGIMFVLLLVMGGGTYLYYKDTQQRIGILQQNNSKLEVAINLSEETLSSLQADYELVSQKITEVNSEFANIRAQNQVLADKLETHDIGILGVSKPELVAKIITIASDKAGRCFEILSGASLTDKEMEAKDGNSFNSECPWLWINTK